MSKFYINSVKRKLKWQRLDLENMLNQETLAGELDYMSASDKLYAQEGADREDAISDLRDKLHDGFSHILNDKKVNDNNFFKEYSNEKKNEMDDLSSNYEIVSQASTVLSEIQDIAGIKSLNNEDLSNVDSHNRTPDILLSLISELRGLTEKRSKVKSNLEVIDNSLIKLQDRIIENKKVYESKIAHLQSINEIYSQSASLVSKIISEDTKYEKL